MKRSTSSRSTRARESSTDALLALLNAVVWLMGRHDHGFRFRTDINAGSPKPTRKQFPLRRVPNGYLNDTTPRVSFALTGTSP